MAITTNQLTLTQLDVLTVPASTTYALTNVLVCNTYSPSGGSASSRGANFTMHIIPSGSALNNNVTCVVKELNLPAGETFTFDTEKVVLEAGDKITVLSQAPLNLSITVSYLEV